jgi:hypothetical protein
MPDRLGVFVLKNYTGRPDHLVEVALDPGSIEMPATGGGV